MIEDTPVEAGTKDPIEALIDRAVGPAQAAATPDAPPRPRLPRLPLKRGQKASEVIPAAELDDLAKRLEERSGIKRASFPAKVAAGAAGTVGEMAKFPKVVVESAKALGVSEETINRHAPFIAPVARAFAEAANVSAEVGQGIQDFSATNLEDPRFAPQDTLSQFGRALGSTLPFAAAGAAGPAARLVGAGAKAAKIANVATVALMGGAQNSVALYEDVLAETGDPEKAMAGALIGFAVGTFEAAGAGGSLAKLDTATGGSVRAALRRMAFEGGGEGAQEFVTTIANGIAGGVIKGKDIDALKLLAESGQAGGIGWLVGAGVDAGLQGAGAAARGLHGQPTQAPGSQGEITPEQEIFLGVQDALRKPPGGGIRYQGEGDAPRAKPAGRTVADIGLETAPGAAGEPKGAGSVTTPPTVPDAAAPGAPEETAKAILGGEEVAATDMTPDAIRAALEMQAQPREEQTPATRGGAFLDRAIAKAEQEAAAESVADNLIELEEEGKASPKDLIDPFFAPGGAYDSMNERGRKAFAKAVERQFGAKPGDVEWTRTRPDGTQETGTFRDIEHIVRSNIEGEGYTFQGLRDDFKQAFGFLMQMAEAQRQHEAGTNPFTQQKKKLEPKPITSPAAGPALGEGQPSATEPVQERAGTGAAGEVSTGPQRVERRTRELNLTQADIEAEQSMSGLVRRIRRQTAGAIDPDLLDQADKDPLTGLANRRADAEQFERIKAASRRKGDRIVRLFGDLDNFKAVNTQFTDAGGDRAIQVVADAWKQAAKEGNGILPARKGGDEFVTTVRVGKDTTDADLNLLRDEMEAIAADALESAGFGTAMGKKVAASIGWVEATEGESLEELTKRAAVEAKKRKTERGVSKTSATGEREDDTTAPAPAASAPKVAPQAAKGEGGLAAKVASAEAEARRIVRAELERGGVRYIPPQMRVGEGKAERLVNVAEILRRESDVESVDLNRYRLKVGNPPGLPEGSTEAPKRGLQSPEARAKREARKKKSDANKPAQAAEPKTYRMTREEIAAEADDRREQRRLGLTDLAYERYKKDPVAFYEDKLAALRNIDSKFTESTPASEVRDTGLSIQLAEQHLAKERAKVEAARVRTVQHPTRGEIEVRGSGAATYWRDPSDTTSPFAGRFILASPEFRAEIERAASEPPKPIAEEAREQARITREVESARKHNESVDREREVATRDKLSPAERAKAIVAAYKPQPEPEARPPSAAPKAALPPGVRITEEEGEVRVYFEKKPDTNYLKKLRAAGYRWSGAMKAWHRPLAGGRQEAAAELFGVSHEGMTATERLADYERRIKDLNAAMKGKRSVARRELQFQIRTLADQIEKVKPAVDAERRASEESNRRRELAKLHAKGARTEIVLGHMAYAEIPEQAEAIAAMRAWVADEAGKAGVKGDEADALENEALRFYATGGDLAIGQADDYSMAAFVRKAIGPLRLSRGIAELNAQIDAARKEAAAAAAPFDYSMLSAIDRIKSEMSGKPEGEILEALQKDIRSRIGQQRISTQTRQAEKIRKESAEEEARWQTLIDDTSEWAEFAAAGNPYVKAAWDGGFHTADESIATDGREMIRLDAIETKAGLGGKTSKALQVFQKKSEGARYGASNPLPKTATDNVWNSAVKADGKKAEVAAVVGPASDKDYTLAFLRRQDGQFVAVDAHRLRAIFRATKADGILVSNRDNPVVVTKAGKPVAIVMPITIGTGNESPRAKFIHEAIGKGGVSEIRRAARARLEEAKAARDKELAALGAKAEPEPEVDDGDSDGIEEMLAFPGALLPDVKEAIDWTFKKLGYIRQQRATVAGTISTEDLVERQIRRFQDSFRGILTLQRDLAKAGGTIDDALDAYLAEELRKGVTKVRLEELDTRVRALLKGLRKDGISPEEFGEALMARHAPERNEVIRKRDPKNDAGSGLTDDEAAAIMERVENGKRAEGFARAFARFDAMIERTREGWVRDGLMSQKDVDELRERFQFYAPLRSDLSEGPDDSPFRGTGRGVDVRGGEFKAALGRSTRAEAREVLAYAFTQAQTAIVRGEKNKVAQTFLNLLRANEDLVKGFAKVSPKQIKKALVGGVVKHVYDPKFKLADNVIAVHEGGEVVWVEIDPRFQNVADGLKNLGAENAGKLVRHLGAWTRYLAGVNTRYNPVFPLFNALRDAGGALINSQEHGLAFASRTVRDVPLALWALTKQKLGKSGGSKWDRLAAEYRASGAPVAFLELRSFEDQVKLLESEMARQRAGGKARVRRGWRAMLNTIAAANDIVENAVRFSAYVHAREDLGMSAKRAASWSKNLTVNFERKGDAGATLNALFMFANASIQSTARVGQAVRHPGVQRLLGAAFLGAMAWDQIMRAIGGEDDDGEDRWDKIPSYIKRHNLVIMRPDGPPITIPTPFVYDWLQTAAHQLSGFISGDVKAGDALGEIASAALEAFDPIGSGNLDLGDPASIARTIAPTVIDPIVELATNRDWKGDPIVYDKFKDEGSPDSADKWPDPSSVSKSVVEWLNKATGGDKFEPGMVDVSPQTLDHLTGILFGGFGRTLSQVYERGQEPKPGDIPVISQLADPAMRRLVREPSPFASAEDFHDLQRAIRVERDRAKEDRRLMPAALGALMKEGNALEELRQRKRKEIDSLEGDAKKVALREMDRTLQLWIKRARKALLTTPDNQ